MQQVMPKSDLEKFDYGIDIVYVIFKAGWPVPILNGLYIVGCVSVCEVTETLQTVARNR